MVLMAVPVAAAVIAAVVGMAALKALYGTALLLGLSVVV
jgi:hypothetical protein